MSLRRLIMVLGLLLLSGCLYQVRQETDRVVSELAAQPYDLQPPDKSAPSKRTSSPEKSSAKSPADPSLDVQTSALMEKPAAVGRAAPRPTTGSNRATPGGVIQRVSLEQADNQPTQADKEKKVLEAIRQRLERLKIPEAVPGSETPPIKWPKEPDKQAAVIDKLYPPLPKLPADPKPRPGPNGRPYTLADFQQIAAANSPELRQAVSDVLAAEGAYRQARTYRNPTIGYEATPSSNGSTPGTQGGFLDQVVSTGGKLKLMASATEIDLQNAQLALRRARSDLATRVRNAYYALLVAREAVRVNKALAGFTDEVYLAQADVLRGGFAAPYEPATLRAQTWTIRLAYKQAITTYISAWTELVATIGLRQLPLSEVAGRIDRLIPYYDYDAVRAYVLRNHTDVLTARNAVEKARYNRMLAQVTPVYPDVELRFDVVHDFVVPPRNTLGLASVSFPLPIFDRNVGNIMSAEAAEVRAGEESHRVEMALTNALSAAYANYKNNLNALEDYRRYILPDQVTNYRGVAERRQVDPSLGFLDLVTAQQTLASNVSTYLGILGTLWTSVVSVADLLQTNDLFQLSEPRELPAVPDLETLLGWFCPHPDLCPGPSPVGGGERGGVGSGPACPPTSGNAVPVSSGSGPKPSGDVAGPKTASEDPGFAPGGPLTPSLSSQGRASDVKRRGTEVEASALTLPPEPPAIGQPFKLDGVPNPPGKADTPRAKRERG